MNIKYLIGIDEVGRGPIAGPLTLCAFKIAYNNRLDKFRGVKDSKQLSPIQREEWFAKIIEEKEKGNVDFAVTSVSSQVLDRIGLTRATYIAIDKCLKKLGADPKDTKILLDGGLKAPSCFVNQKTIIKGDEKIKVIALASISAKVLRDRMMMKFSNKYKGYAFEKHKGYGTKAHYNALKELGLCDIHRRSFL